MEKKGENTGKLLILGIPAALTVVFFLLTVLLKAPLFCLNDDLQLRDILAGRLGDSPDLHTVYMRAPLSFILSFFYRILPDLPWFGLFLCLCMAVCFYFLLRSVTQRLLPQAESAAKTSPEDAAAPLKTGGSAEEASVKPWIPWSVAAGLLLLTAIYLLYLKPVLIMPHYTLVAAVCGATSLWLLLQKKASGGRGFDIPAFILLLLCEQIRSQVFVMLLPFAAAVLLLRFLSGKGQEERRVFRKKLLIFAAVWLVLFLCHKLAYLSYPWPEYLELNDARTELYDYSGVWESDTAKEYYKKTVMRTEAALPLYLNYDLLPDENARAEGLSALAAYREPSRDLSTAEKLKNVLYELRVRSLSPEKGEVLYAWPYLFTVLAGLVFFGLKKKRIPFLALCGGLCLHFGLYAYLLWNGRVPERVTVSLYLIGTLYAAGLLIMERDKRLQTALLASAAAVFLLASVFTDTHEAYDKQITVNQTDDVVYSYMAEHPDTLFLLETYATVNRTVPVFKESGIGNVLLMGGWQYGSPLQEEKLKRFAYEDRSELFTKGGACVVFREGEGLTPEELEAFLEERYPEGARLKEETRLSAEDAAFLIYKLE